MSGPDPKAVADDLSDLPAEVRSQLRKIKAPHEAVSPMDAKPVAIIAALGGDVSIDRVLIEMWRRHKIVMKRATLTGRLYRASLAGLIERVPDRKGYYRSNDRRELETRP